jgi:integrase
MRGLGRIYQRGTMFWIAYHRGKGQGEARESGGRTEGEARALLKQRLGELAAGTFRGPQLERLTVGDCLEHYLMHLEVDGAKSLAPVRSVIRRLWPTFGALRVVDLRPAVTDRWITDRLAAGVARGTIAQSLARLRAALSLAHKRGDITARPYVPSLSVSNTRQGFLAPERFEAFVSRLPDPVDDIARFAYLTGWRREEILTLRWEHVDFARGEIRLGDTKNGDGRAVPLHYDDATGHRHPLAFAQVIASRWKQRALTPWVFHRHGARVVRFVAPWKAAAAAIDMPGLYLHDFRRSAIRNMLDAGVPEKVVMMISGHRSYAVFQRYNIRTLRDVSAGLRATDVFLADKMRTITG